jgi:hypothetical protein
VFRVCATVGKLDGKISHTHLLRLQADMQAEGLNTCCNVRFAGTRSNTKLTHY